MIWGIDLGVRSIYMAGLTATGELILSKCEIKVKGSIKDQPMTARAEELREIASHLRHITPQDSVYVEAPPAAGSKNLQTYGKLHQVAGVVLCNNAANSELVPVDTWKLYVAGKGGLSKELVASYLQKHFLAYSELCAGDQNLIDATCIALYGLRRANGLGGSE